MPLADEMLFQRIETLLDMRFRKLHDELKRAHEDIAALKDEFEKHAKDSAQRDAPAFQPQWQEPAPQQWAQAPPQYPQQGDPQQAPAGRYAGQFAAASAPVPEPPRNKWASPSERPASTEPIDRNGVAPSEVSIEKFFYMGNKKK